eukprot:PITA_16553
MIVNTIAPESSNTSPWKSRGTANRGRNARGSGIRGQSSLSRNSQYDSRGLTQVNCWGYGGLYFQCDCLEASLSIMHRTGKEPSSNTQGNHKIYAIVSNNQVAHQSTIVESSALGTYDFVIDMDWLEAHQAWVDCYGKRILCINDEGETIQIQGIKRRVSLRFILAMQMKCFLRKGCQAYAVQEVSKEKGPSLDQYLILVEFPDVFPKEIPGLPLERELDLTIELKPGTKPIS